MSGDVWLTAWLRPRNGGELDRQRAQSLWNDASPRANLHRSREACRADRFRPRMLPTASATAPRKASRVVAEHWRSVVMSAPIDKLIDAFGATAGIYELPDKRRFRHRSGPLHAPPEIAAMLRGPFGIHQWPRSHAVCTLQSGVTPLFASDIVSRYRFPDADGSGVTVWLVLHKMRGEF